MIPIALAALTKVDFALFAVITQMLTAVMLAEIGIRSACARLLIDARAKGEAEYNKVWMASACVFCMQAIVMLLLILFLAPFLGQIFHLDPEQRSVARNIFIVVGIINTAGYALSIFSTALVAGQKLSHVNVIATVGAIVQLVVFVICIKSGLKLWSYPVSMLVGMVCSQTLVIYRAVKMKIVGKFDLSLFEWAEVKAIFTLGMDVFVAALFSVVMGHSLLLFSGHLLTLEQTAILAVNLKLVNMMTQILHRIPGSAEPMLMKMVSENKHEQFRVWWQLITKMTVLSALFCAGMFVFWNRLVVATWTQEEMVMQGGALILLSLVPFRFLVHWSYVQALAIFKELRRIKWLLLWEIVLYIILAVSLGSRFGLIGLLSANLLSMLGGALPRGMQLIAKFGVIPLRSIFLNFSRVIVPSFVGFSLIYYWGGEYMNSSILSETLISIVWLMVSALTAYCIVLDKSEKLKLGGFVKGLLKRGDGVRTL